MLSITKAELSLADAYKRKGVYLPFFSKKKKKKKKKIKENFLFDVLTTKISTNVKNFLKSFGYKCNISNLLNHNRTEKCKE